MGAPSGFGGGLGGGVDFQRLTSDIIGHFKSKKDARKAEQLYRKRWQTMVNDMKAAGINPLLAVGASPGQLPPFPQTHMGGGGEVSMASGLERELTSARSATERQALKIGQATEDSIREGIKASFENRKRTNAERWLTEERLDLLRREREFFEQNAPQMLRSQELSNRALELDMPRRSAESGFYEDIGEAGPWTRFFLNMGSVLDRGRGSVAPRHSRPGRTPNASTYRYRRP